MTWSPAGCPCYTCNFRIRISGGLSYDQMVASLRKVMEVNFYESPSDVNPWAWSRP
jgi:hypothetical protein